MTHAIALLGMNHMKISMNFVNKIYFRNDIRSN